MQLLTAPGTVNRMLDTAENRSAVVYRRLSPSRANSKQCISEVSDAAEPPNLFYTANEINQTLSNFFNTKRKKSIHTF